jgi:hypothetical protein
VISQSFYKINNPRNSSYSTVTGISVGTLLGLPSKTISIKIVKATLVNPADALRGE